MQCIKNIFEITAVTDMCGNKLQKTPMSLYYLRNALQQVEAYMLTIDLAVVSQEFSKYCSTTIAQLMLVCNRSCVSLELVLRAYGLLHKIIILLLIHYYNFLSLVSGELADRFKLCLDYVKNNELHKAVCLGETIVPLVTA